MSAPMAIDQSLDTLIKSNRASKRAAKSKAATKVEKKKTSSVTKAKKAVTTGKAKPAAGAAAATAAVAPTSTKIIVSNLPPDVKEQEFRELFSKTIGPIREATLNFDSKGKSKGVGSVVFSKKEDAVKAVQTYHNRLIDGHRQMKVELVLQAGRAPAPPTLAQRVSAAPGGASAPTVKKNVANALAKKKASIRKKVARTKRPAATAADLDAQMDDYSAAAATSTTAA